MDFLDAWIYVSPAPGYQARLTRSRFRNVHVHMTLFEPIFAGTRDTLFSGQLFRFVLRVSQDTGGYDLKTL